MQNLTKLIAALNKLSFKTSLFFSYCPQKGRAILASSIFSLWTRRRWKQ